MSSNGRHHMDREPSDVAAAAGREATLDVPHPMPMQPHVDKLQMVVNQRVKGGILKGYDGHCKATGAEVKRTYLTSEHDVKDKEGRVIRTDTVSTLMPTSVREPAEVGNG